MPDDDEPILDPDAFEKACGVSLSSVLDLNTWEAEPDLAAMCKRMEDEVGEAVLIEDEMNRTARYGEVFKMLTDPNREGAPPNAGVFRTWPDDLHRVWKQVLFNGAVEVCDGTRVEFDTLPMTITQIGVCLASYQGNQQSFAHRLFQRDLRVRSGDLLDDLLALLDSRAARSRADEERAKGLSNLAGRGIMAYAERAALTYKSEAPWRMGHGHPAPYELLTGSGSMELLDKSIKVLTDLIIKRKRFVFVPSAANDKRLLTLGGALKAGEFAVFQTAQAGMEYIVNNGHYSTEKKNQAKEFCRTVGPQIAVGVYKASDSAPPNLFYSHVEHSHEAALIAMADSLLQEHRGFPLLIDLADRLCRSAFGNDIFEGAIQSAYARAGAPFRFLGERQTRG